MADLDPPEGADVDDVDELIDALLLADDAGVPGWRERLIEALRPEGVAGES